jgi:anaerobic magnesium-protoporphyrin IX monomethyl ester cyclase
LEALIAENVPVQLITTIRASDIVRDADILHLYKKAGFSRILMGVETTNADTQARIRKGATTATDREAVRLLRQHDILSQVAYVVGFEEETDRDLLHGLRQLLSYDPDQINAMYVTPHRWTPFYRASAGRRVIEVEQSRWDYRHQVLATRISPWRVFLWEKLTEAVLQLRPRALRRVMAHGDPVIRKALRWCYGVGRRAWLFEVRSFFSRQRRRLGTITLAEFWGEPQDADEEALEPTTPIQARGFQRSGTR